MQHKSPVVREAEEIISNYKKKQSALSHRFRIKKRRKLPPGFFLLFGVGISIVFWVMLFFWIF